MGETHDKDGSKQTSSSSLPLYITKEKKFWEAEGQMGTVRGKLCPTTEVRRKHYVIVMILEQIESFFA